MRCIPAMAFSARTPRWRGAARRRASPSSARRRRRWSCSATRPRPRRWRSRCGVPIIEGTSGPTTLDEAKAFFASLGAGGAVMIKAIAGGGGRGMRIVDDAAKLEEAYARCQSEAKAAFGSDGVYVERLIRNARHIEVQIIGDHHGAISHLWERECTIQRRNQKLIEVAPSPSLSDSLRTRIIDAAKELAAAANYDNLGTFEFLVDGDAKRRRAGLRLHRGQSAAAGRAHRDRGGARRRSGAGAARGRRRRHAGLARPGAGLYPEAARLCDAASRQHGGDGRERRDQADRRDARRCSTCRPAPACASIRSAIPATRPAPPSTRCSPRSSCIRPARTGPTWCRRPRAPCANSASAASPPIFRSSARCWRIRISSPTASTPVSSIRMSPRWSHAANDLSAPELLEAGAAVTDPRGRRNLGRVGRSGRLRPGAGAAAGHDRRHRGRRRRSGAPGPADRRARIHEDGASGRPRRMAAR